MRCGPVTPGSLSFDKFGRFLERIRLGGHRSRRPWLAGYTISSGLSRPTGAGFPCGLEIRIAPPRTIQFTEPAKCCWPMANLGKYTPNRPNEPSTSWYEHQNEDGGWGGGASVKYAGISANSSSTIEETAVALEGLLCGGQPRWNATIMHALGWLTNTIQSGNLDRPWPIGFYFAKLWYHERLYPAIFSLGALGTAIECANECAKQHSPRET